MNLAQRKSHGELEKHLIRSESFSKSRKSKNVFMTRQQWRKVAVWTFMLTLVHVIAYVQFADHGGGQSGIRRHLAEVQPFSPRSELDSPQPDSPWYGIAQTAKKAERGILDFFNGDKRALENGVPMGGTLSSTHALTQRLARRIALCHTKRDEENCILRVVFIGSAQTSGHDVFYNDTFPFLAEKRLRPIAEAAGLELQVMNHAQDSDHTKEGPQSTHMCVANLVGDSVDVIAWDLDHTMQGAPSAQFEAFVRWAFASDPAMIMINRGGPHARSRRGKRNTLFGFGLGNFAEVWEDEPDDVPEQREEPYIGSDDWKARWETGRNDFWKEIIDQYHDFVDFAAIDPAGSIWTLDHLIGFSNAAFEADKALPLLDCGNDHPAPCNQVPPFVATKLKATNVSLESIPQEILQEGAVCSALFGCKNIRYGGKRSHELRGELNALPIVRSFKYAASILASISPSDLQDLARTTDEDAVSSANRRALSVEFLPPPKNCSAVFCNRLPTCMTSYIPNMGLSLSSAILTDKDASPLETMPRLGAGHFADNPEWAIDNLEKRSAPLGYVDRKFAYRLTEDKPTPIIVDGNVTDELEPEDSASVDIGFIMKGAGPVVVCEPPCLIGCSKMRRMPLLAHVELELDGVILDVSPHLPSAVEVGGAYCKTIAEDVNRGEHILRIISATKAPHYVMFSHLVTFS